MQDKAFIDQLARKRAAGISSLLIAWKGALECLPQLPEKELELVVAALPSPESCRRLGRFISRDKNHAESLMQLVKEVDGSDEPLEEWLAAFEVLASFLESTSQRPSLSECLGYLHCCEAVAHSGAHFATFPMAVETMLETYGYSGEQD